MNILLLGGTGALGIALTDILKNSEAKLYVTSRSLQQSKGNVQYIQGNAMDLEFVKSLMDRQYDAIVDYMIYPPQVFQSRFRFLLKHTDQYFFLSSSRVYAQSVQPLTEQSPRILDICKDYVYLATDEYALAKAREEDLLRSSNMTNWTIIRPYITYNSNRLQLGVFEKENWLYRALQGRTIVFPRDIAERRTSFTYGADVSRVMAHMIGNPKAYGKTFHIVNSEKITWNDVLELYLEIIEHKTGKRPAVKIVDTSESLMKVWSPWQIKYDRKFDREFDSSAVQEICGDIEFVTVEAGITKCLTAFLEHPSFLKIKWRFEAWADKQVGEFTSFKEIEGVKNQIKYLKQRLL